MEPIFFIVISVASRILVLGAGEGEYIDAVNVGTNVLFDFVGPSLTGL